MSLTAVRAAMMTRFSMISGVVVPPDPLPVEIVDKTIVVFPRLGDSAPISRGRVPASVAIQYSDILQVEYHRRIAYRELGTTFGDITDMIETITNVCWSEHAGGKFDGTVFSIERVALAHFGAIGWNEWTFGARLEVSFIHQGEVSA